MPAGRFVIHMLTECQSAEQVLRTRGAEYGGRLSFGKMKFSFFDERKASSPSLHSRSWWVACHGVVHAEVMVEEAFG